LGFAVQLCTLRWRGHFLGDTRQVPDSVLATIASQLGVLPMPIEGYPQNEKTRFEHLERIRQHLKFARYGALQRQELLDHLITVAQAFPRATALRHVADRWLAPKGCTLFCNPCWPSGAASLLISINRGKSIGGHRPMSAPGGRSSRGRQPEAWTPEPFLFLPPWKLSVFREGKNAARVSGPVVK
jgi:Domain of unknown function (DUF4158)